MRGGLLVDESGKLRVSVSRSVAGLEVGQLTYASHFERISDAYEAAGASVWAVSTVMLLWR